MNNINNLATSNSSSNTSIHSTNSINSMNSISSNNSIINNSNSNSNSNTNNNNNNNNNPTATALRKSFPASPASAPAKSPRTSLYSSPLSQSLASSASSLSSYSKSDIRSQSPQFFVDASSSDDLHFNNNSNNNISNSSHNSNSVGNLHTSLSASDAISLSKQFNSSSISSSTSVGDLLSHTNPSLDLHNTHNNNKHLGKSHNGINHLGFSNDSYNNNNNNAFTPSGGSGTLKNRRLSSAFTGDEVKTFSQTLLVFPGPPLPSDDVPIVEFVTPLEDEFSNFTSSSSSSSPSSSFSAPSSSSSAKPSPLTTITPENSIGNDEPPLQSPDFTKEKLPTRKKANNKLGKFFGEEIQGVTDIRRESFVINVSTKRERDQLVYLLFLLL